MLILARLLLKILNLTKFYEAAKLSLPKTCAWTQKLLSQISELWLTYSQTKDTTVNKNPKDLLPAKSLMTFCKKKGH